MASKLNLGIKEVYDQTKKMGASVEDAASSLKADVEAKVISVQKSKTPLLSKLKTRSTEFLKNHKVDVKYLLLGIPITVAFLIASIIQNNQTIGTQAAVHQASVAFQLASWDLPPQGTFGVWVNSDSPVAFSDVELSFDPKLVKMTTEVAIKTGLTRKIRVTSMADANATGKISIILGLEPSMIGNPPSGAFQIADLTFSSNTSSQNVSTKITFTNPSMQLVAVDQSVFTLTTTGIDLVINRVSPTPSPTPVPTASPTPTPKPTSTPIPVPTTSAGPTATAVPTKAPTPVPTPAPTSTRAPTVAPIPTAAPTPQRKVLLSGTVTNASNHNLISGITVTVRDRWGRIAARGRTDGNGHYGFYLTTGSYRVTASGIGYGSNTVSINLSADYILNFAISRWRFFGR
ncbi:MAG: carboxypeptidase-like regulatory domain-containing protein [Candidatus Woesebacteria bacterium]|nr:carboxypeptidase-like regulatory domain-containing protein [Candidatus Woesebacteria bacterium]